MKKLVEDHNIKVLKESIETKKYYTALVLLIEESKNFEAVRTIIYDLINGSAPNDVLQIILRLEGQYDRL